MHFIFDASEHRDEFEREKISNNIEKCKKGGLALILLNLILITVDIIVYKPMRPETPAYLYLYYSHLAVSALILLWYALLVVVQNSRVISNKVLCYLFINIVLYWCVYMGINGLNISGQISAYIICPLALSAVLYLSPKEAFINYMGSLIVFILGLYITVPESKVLFSHIVNVGITVFFAQVVSNINYVSFQKDFIYKKQILGNKLELEGINHKLKEYEKLRTDFFANISHELRTPLNVIYSAQQMIDVAQIDNKRASHYSKTIKQNCFRLIRLINNLIDITKIDALSFDVKFVNSNIVKVVEDITLSVADYIEHKGINLTFDTEIEEKIIACDPNIIERIMLNLLSNAVKFTGSGGDILVGIVLKNDSICISVKDNGIGISNEMKSLIFDRFIQVDKSVRRSREGSGIGLALVKSLVEIHKGTIYVESDLGKGSEFVISFPVVSFIESDTNFNSFTIVDNHIDMINVEFSDIYD
jgi:signal transduction histidine kinase